jgi:hypothetical protein
MGADSAATAAATVASSALIACTSARVGIWSIALVAGLRASVTALCA